jgi:group I intron endonuclease
METYGYIYKTTNLINNMFYIGQHKGEFDSDYLGSGKRLQFVIKKYGRKNFKPEIICYTNNRQYADLLEKYHIREHKLKYGKDIMYNITEGGEGFRGNHSEESKEKNRLAHLGKKASKETKKKMRESIEKRKKVFGYINSPEAREKMKIIGKKQKGKIKPWSYKSVMQFSKKNIFIKQYDSIKEAANITGVPNNNICKVCKNKRDSAGGFIWRYSDESN